MSELVPLMMVVEGVTLTVVPSSTATMFADPLPALLGYPRT